MHEARVASAASIRVGCVGDSNTANANTYAEREMIRIHARQKRETKTDVHKASVRQGQGWDSWGQQFCTHKHKEDDTNVGEGQVRQGRDTLGTVVLLLLQMQTRAETETIKTQARQKKEKESRLTTGKGKARVMAMATAGCVGDSNSANTNMCAKREMTRTHARVRAVRQGQGALGTVVPQTQCLC